MAKKLPKKKKLKIKNKSKVSNKKNLQKKIVPKKRPPKKIVVKKQPTEQPITSEPSETRLVETRPANKTPRVKRGTGGIMYFTQDTENAVVAYNTTHDREEKNRLYNEKIKHAFEKIAENIFNVFKFSYNEVSPLKVQEECVSHMVANMEKYDQSKGKAYGYFSIIAKHWFILENNNNYRRFKKHTSISEQPGDVGEFVVEPDHQRKEMRRESSSN